VLDLAAGRCTIRGSQSRTHNDTNCSFAESCRRPAIDPSKGEVTQLLQLAAQGDRGADDELARQVDGELRRMARNYMRRERPDHTLQATALVNELYLRLVDQNVTTWQNRAHFFGVSARIMRRLLVDHAREHQAAKRGGEIQKVPLDEELAGLLVQQQVDLLDVDRALEALEHKHPREHSTVQLHFFIGQTVEEIAEIQQVSSRTVKRDLNFAKTWLYRELSGRSRKGKGDGAGVR
jgi:RNA polymerase sigma factor (TIGR02999 family)